MKNSLLSAKNVTKTFGSIQAVQAANLSLNPNEWIAIVGGSGCGKSTFAKMVTRLETISSGDIYFNNRPIHTIPLHSFYQDVQMIFQDPLSTFSTRMTIRDYMCEPLCNFLKLSKKEAMKYACTLLRWVHLDESLLLKYPHELSGGQLQRIVIARAISVEPKLLICDECTSALDMSIQQEIVQVLQDLRKKIAFSNLFITHDIHLAITLCEKIYVMHQGVFVEELQPETFFQSKHPYTQQLIEASQM